MTSVVSKAGSCPFGDALNPNHDEGASALIFVHGPLFVSSGFCHLLKDLY